MTDEELKAEAKHAAVASAAARWKAHRAATNKSLSPYFSHSWTTGLDEGLMKTDLLLLANAYIESRRSASEDSEDQRDG